MSLYADIEYDEELDNDAEHVGFGSLLRVLEHISVRTVMINRGEDSGIWLKGSGLRKLLEIMSALKVLSLRINNTAVWASLKRPGGAQIDPQVHSFPLLENISITSPRISSTQGLVEMVASHSIQQMVLGAAISQNRSGRKSTWEPLPKDSQVV
ncbi:hypothetical protein B0J17DRAFT_723351 [Rhizoctonia solani]|nr:hypothetical protein B0J17DRAFT_723351 [Rhizoctonia solani]